MFRLKYNLIKDHKKSTKTLVVFGLYTTLSSDKFINFGLTTNQNKTSILYEFCPFKFYFLNFQ